MEARDWKSVLAVDIFYFSGASMHTVKGLTQEALHTRIPDVLTEVFHQLSNREWFSAGL